MNLESIGYKKTFDGSKMWHWKVEKEGGEYLICEIIGNHFIVMQWDGYEFGENDFSKEEIETLKVKTGIVPKNREEIEDDKDWTALKRLYTTGELKEPEPPYVREPGRYSDDEVNELLSFLIFELNIENNGKTTITQEMVDEDEYGLLNDLLGYDIEVETDGYHKNDGQMVEYDFTFYNPNGETFSISTEMCLMVGFNYHKSFEIPILSDN